jgi:hypothetical protein
MVLDLSYLADKPSEAQEKALQAAIAKACIDSIVQYLTEVADTMVANNIPALNEPTIRAMIAAFQNQNAE